MELPLDLEWLGLHQQPLKTPDDAVVSRRLLEGVLRLVYHYSKKRCFKFIMSR